MSQKATRSGQPQTIRVPLHQAAVESDGAYHFRARYSRAWGPSSETGTRLQQANETLAPVRIHDRAQPRDGRTRQGGLRGSTPPPTN